MTIIEAAISGAVQGLTEFLPVSSSGHLSLIQYFTGRGEEAGLLFVILLHLGTLLAVLLAFWNTILNLVLEFAAMISDIFTGKFRLKNMPPRRRMIFLLIVSLLPMAAAYFFRDFFDAAATDNDIIVEGVCFIITSILLVMAAKCVGGHKNAGSMTYRDALVVGVVQAVAPMPGISRSGSTIATGVLTGLDREFAIAFSFIMGVPTVLAANVLEIGEAVSEGSVISVPVIATGITAALVFGLIAIKLVRWLATSGKFIYFAWYTGILGILTLIAGVVEKMSGAPIQAWVTGLIK